MISTLLSWTVNGRSSTNQAVLPLISSANPGWLRLTTTSPPERDLIGSIETAPRVMTSGITGDYTIETKISAVFTNNDEGAGILIWKDSGQYLRFERMSRTIGHPVEQQIYFGVNNGGYFAVTLPSNINPTYLELVKSGSTFTAYYAQQENVWVGVGSLTVSFNDPGNIGLDLINVYHSDTTFADFDYFQINPAYDSACS